MCTIYIGSIGLWNFLRIIYICGSLWVELRPFQLEKYFSNVEKEKLPRQQIQDAEYEYLVC